MSYKFAHLADIHWRGLTRHNEYKRSFEDAFRNMRAANLDGIFIVGDIVHSKTQGISPELIDCLSWWFKELQDIAPTFVTLGNHDGLILNKDRQDAISPIIKALNLPNITLIKNTEVITNAISKPGLEPINLVNYSCFDEHSWGSTKKPESGINIALFHGAVWGSKTDSNWALDGEIETSFFDGFDFVFLGDIHKHQYLDDQKRIAYCGSTIQQNFGEDPGKGFMIWDIASKDEYDSSHVLAKHDRPFVTIDWMGSVHKTLDEAEAYPDCARFRIVTKVPISQGEIKQLYSALKEFKSASEIVMKHDVIRSGKIKGILEKDPAADFRNPNVVVRSILEYYGDAGLSDRTKNQLSELVHTLWKNAVKLDRPKGQKWSLQSLEFDNTFGYGKDNLIDFESLEGITGIFGQNRVGKSSIPGTIMYALFNGTDRGSMSNLHVVNTRKGHCKANALISSVGKKYKIERQTVKRQNKKGELSATTQLNLFEIDDAGSIIRDLCGEQRRETEKTLKGILGSPEDFLLTSLASQGEMNTFLKQKASSRKSVLSKFLELDVFDLLHAAARDESAGVKQLLRATPPREYEVSIIDAKNKLKYRETIRTQQRSTLNDQRRQIREIELALATRDDSSLVTLTDVENQRKRLNFAKKEIEDAEQNLDKLSSEESDASEKLLKLKEFRESFPMEDIKIELEEQRELSSEVVDKKHAIEKEKQKLKGLKCQVDKLVDVPCGDAFPECQYIISANKAKKKLQVNENTVQDLKDDLSAIRKTLTKIKTRNLDEKLLKYEELIDKYNEFNEQNSSTKLLIAEQAAQIEKLITEKKDQEKRLHEMSANISKDESVIELTRLRKKLQQIKESYADQELKCSQTSEDIGLLQSDILSLKERKEEFDSLVEKWKVFNLFLQATSKNGVPLEVIRTRLPEINSEIASILQGVTGFTVELESQEGSADLQVYINYGDSKRIIECCSGMEKMMSAMAIRVALINVSSLPKPDMFIIDEGFGSLDNNNIESCNRFLESLKKWFRIVLIISHVDAVKDSVDHVLEVRRKGLDASIKH